MQLYDNITLGLDIGIASIGWILIRNDSDGTVRVVTRTLKNGKVIEAAGVRLVDVPEDPKTKELLSQHRRSIKRQRITIKRRARRMRLVRELVSGSLYASASDVEQMHHSKSSQISPWQLRKEALSRLLSDYELAVVLIHMAKHRGFLSNSKKDKTDKSSDTGKMLKAIGEMEARIRESGSPTIGAFLAGNTVEINHGGKIFSYGVQRNRSGMDGKPEYSYTAQRLLVAAEADRIFNAQRKLGNSKASQEFLERYKELAFEQLPLQSVEALIGDCSFMEGEKRAPKYAPTSEKFRLVQKLCNLRLKMPDDSTRSLTELERKSVVSLLGAQKGISYTAVRKKLKLDDNIVFEGLDYGASKDGRAAKPEKDDVVSRSKPCAPGHATLGAVLGDDLFRTMLEQRAANGHRLADEISKIISDNDDKNEIKQRFEALGLAPGVTSTLMQAVSAGKFSEFGGVMSLSLKAMEAIIPCMLECGDYASGCELAGFDHTMTQAADWNNVKNPLVLRMLREVRKLVETVVREFGVIPGRIHIETARDLGKSVEERNAIERGMNENRSRNDRMRAELAEHFGCSPSQISASELMRYKLWVQQQGKCCYYMLWHKAGGEPFYAAKSAVNGSIGVAQLRDGLNEVQIDHILPYSRTFDSGFNNLGLCINAANQHKGNRSPYEWVGQKNEQSWHEFEQWINALSAKGFKKRNYLLKNLEEKQGTFTERNINDTRYICRVIMDWLKRDFYASYDVLPEYDEKGREKRRVFARPGQLTSFLRKSWGLESIKKDASGQRTGDKHHALDAFLVACCSEGLLQKITKAFQKKEEHLLAQELPPPMPDCRRNVERMLGEVFPSRAERGKIKGALHEETLRAIVKEKDSAGNEVSNLYLKTPISKLKLDDLDKIKDANRCPDIIRPLRKWIEAGKPQDSLPCSDVTGFPIKKVRLRQGAFTSGVTLRRGNTEVQASNGSMVRVDVFVKAGKYYLVPVYSWQAAQGILPNRAIAGGKPEAEWPEMDDSYEFKFSLYPNNYLLMERGENVLEGYYVTTDRANGTLTISPPYDKQSTSYQKSIGARTLKSLRKFRVDRLGRLHEVKKEKRTLK